MPADGRTGLLLATALHAGFQLTVSTVVYPGLADRSPAAWPAAHARHSARITPLVAVLYPGLALAAAMRLRSSPTAAGMVAAACSGAAITLTALAAAPSHGRLGQGHDVVEIRRLLRADRGRAAFALAALAAAVVDVADRPGERRGSRHLTS